MVRGIGFEYVIGALANPTRNIYKIHFRPALKASKPTELYVE